MSGCDDLPDENPSVSLENQLSTNHVARDWALRDERAQSERLFEDLVRAVEAEVHISARAVAYRLVGANDVDDAISTAWEKLLAKRPWRFEPGRGTFPAFFFVVLRSTCLDIIRRRKTEPQTAADTTWEDVTHDQFFPGTAPPEDEIMQRIAGIEDRIAAAIEVLDLSATHREMLRLMVGSEEAATPVGPRAAATARQQRRRVRDRLAELAALTPGEIEAVRLVRTHHTVAKAAAVAPDMDVPELFAAAKRKTLALFTIEIEA